MLLQDTPCSPPGEFYSGVFGEFTTDTNSVASSPSEQDDAQLVRASQVGNEDAFALLMQRHQRRIFTMAWRMLQDYEEANEITQEAFFAAWQGLPAFRGEALFSTWLYRIFYHCCLRQLERRKRERTLQAVVQAKQILKV